MADAPEASPSSTAPLTGASAPDRFTAIGAGGTHTCAMDNSGRVWCWGWDESGQLGRGEPSDGPTAVVGEHEFTEIRAGDGFTCALDPTGATWCWGLDHHGQLGDGDPVGGQADAPLLVAGARDFSSVAAGGGEGWGAGHACALDGDGRAWCWGSDDYGQIGDGARSNGDHAAPVLVAGERRFSAVSTNGEQSCALDRQHRAWCWGAYHYEIYDDWFDRSIGDVPQRVPGGHDFTQIATSGMGACALDSKGRAWCWGANRSGRLGDGEAASSDEVGEFSDAPVAVAGRSSVRRHLRRQGPHLRDRRGRAGVVLGRLLVRHVRTEPGEFDRLDPDRGSRGP